VFNCDHQFALDLQSAIGNYTESYHLFLGPFDNLDPSNCIVGGVGAYDPDCCGGTDRTKRIFNFLISLLIM